MKLGFREALPCGGDDRLFHPIVSRFEKARRVDENNLRIVLHDDTQDARARRLHLAGDDRDFFTDDGIDQRGFACIRRADDGAKPAICFRIGHYDFSWASILRAASFSAWRREGPSAETGA